jgi:predicted TIM-barrel fold metal-dependent hydrolase
MPARLDFPVYDADNHFYETIESFTRYLPKRFEGAIRYVQVDGRTKIAIRNKISDYIPNPTFEVVAAPGAWEGYYRGHNEEGLTLREITGKPIRCLDAFRNPDMRLKLMDEQGIHATLMFPTLASLLEERMKDDIELTHAAIHAFNQWIFDEWTFNVDDRIYPTPIITLPDVDKAVAELEWCLERGARTVLVRPAPVPTAHGATTSPGLPEFDPFWSAVEQAGIPVMLHASDSGYDRYCNDWEGGGRDEFLPFKPQAFRMIVSPGRPIFDTLAALIAHGMFDRHPGVRVAAVENGAAWVRPLVDNLETAYHKMPQEFAEDPVETLRRHVWIHPFYEEDIRGFIDLIGVERVIFGSDFPHPEGLGDPVSYVNDLEGLDDGTVRKIMSDNLRDLLETKPVGA